MNTTSQVKRKTLTTMELQEKGNGFSHHHKTSSTTSSSSSSTSAAPHPAAAPPVKSAGGADSTGGRGSGGGAGAGGRIGGWGRGRREMSRSPETPSRPPETSPTGRTGADMPAGILSRSKVGLPKYEALLLPRRPPAADESKEEGMGTPPSATGFSEKFDVDGDECEKEACMRDEDAVGKSSNGDEKRSSASLTSVITAAEGGCTKRQRASEEKGRDVVSRSITAADLRKKYA